MSSKLEIIDVTVGYSVDLEGDIDIMVDEYTTFHPVHNPWRLDICVEYEGKVSTKLKLKEKLTHYFGDAVTEAEGETDAGGYFIIPLYDLQDRLREVVDNILKLLKEDDWPDTDIEVAKQYLNRHLKL